MARQLLVLLVGLLAFAWAMGALAEAKPAPEPTDAEAQFELGRRLKWGLEGTKKDPRAAVKWFRLAAEQGHPKAQTQLGLAYQQGRVVPRDLEESLRWMRKAAEQGHPKAQFELGVAYRDGRGVPKDKVLALMWLFLSQEKGGIVSRLVMPGVARQLKPSERKEALELARQWREAHGLATPAAKPAAGPETPADSEAAPKPGDGATPEEAAPQEGGAAPSA